MRVIAFCVPKCANTSIKRAFMDLLGKTGRAHVQGQFDMVSKWTAAYKYPDFFKFAFVRNPYSRLVSCYNNKVQRKIHAPMRRFGITKKTTFEKFIETVFEYHDSIADQHFRSMSYDLVINDDVKTPVLVPDFVGTVETIERDWKYVVKRVYEASGKRLPDLPRANMDETNSRSWQDYYTPRLKELVQRRYAMDFEVFGYDY